MDDHALNTLMPIAAPAGISKFAGKLPLRRGPASKSAGTANLSKKDELAPRV
jgi:hypothetical protein